MSLFYRLAYAFGLTPWERASETHGHLVAALLDREEARRERPFGPALELGCGSGRWTVELARRGWDAVGVDDVPKAVRAARERAAEAGVGVRFVEGDVTALRRAGVGRGFRLLLDIGCFHGLDDEQRVAMGEEVTAVAAADAVLLALVWLPGRRGPLPRGASRSDLARAFAGWTIVAEDAIDAAALPRLLRSAAPRCYRLRRDGAPAREA